MADLIVLWWIGFHFHRSATTRPKDKTGRLDYPPETTYSIYKPVWRVEPQLNRQRRFIWLGSVDFFFNFMNFLSK